jgi:lysine-N-methylase
MSEGSLPSRPRLGSHVLARKHLVDDEPRVLLHDTRTGRLLQIGTREWGLLAAADGTRDLAGILLAASREGAYARREALGAFLSQLHAAGLLEDGLSEATGANEAPPDAGRPLDVLPDFSLHCDGRGSCCRIYASVIFGPVEAARARSLLPMILDSGARHERAFLPDRGSAETGGSAVALRDGRCIYLDDAGRCGLHARGGPSAKPLGCNLYPASFIDDGERVRVSVSVECACILRSVGRAGGAPLIPSEVRVRGDLDEAVFIETLPARARITSATAAPRDEIRAWFARLASLTPAGDLAAALWSLGDAVALAGLAPDALGSFEQPKALTAAAVRPFIEALHRRASLREREDTAFRSERDLARCATRWIGLATSALLAPGALASLIAEPAAAPEGEAFYLRAALHGYRLLGDLPLATALQDRAARILVARALGVMFEGLRPDDPAADEPLALVEAMLRGHGLDAYAYDLG